MARFDLLKATNALACKLTKWDKKCDLQLRRLVAYIWSSLGKRLVGYVSQEDKQTGLHLYTDADLGGGRYSTLYHWRVPLHERHGHHVSFGGNQQETNMRLSVNSRG